MMQTFVLVMIFLSVAGLVLGVGFWVSSDHAIGRRLGRLREDSTGLEKEPADNDSWHARVARIATPIAWLARPREGWESSNLKVRFMNAGLRGPAWPVIFFGVKALLTLALPGLILLYHGLADVTVTATVALLVLLSSAALGYYFPNLALALIIRARQRELEEALPDAVDVMQICVEAGLGLDAAMNRAGQEIGLRSQVLADELKLVALDLRVGSTRDRALQNFALRTGVDDIATFVTILMQSEHFGTNVTESLRILSETMREHRKVRAEERAAKIPLKLLFPLIFLIFPSLFVVLIGPVAIDIYRVLLPTMVGSR